jgi:hypothetical protein
MFAYDYSEAMAYGWAVAFGTLYAIVSAFTSFVVLVMTGGQWENQSAAEAGSDDWLRALSVVWLVAAFAVFGGVMTGRLWLVATGVAVSGIIGLLALRKALGDWSDHGDGQVTAFAVGVGAAGLLAVALTARASREPVETR